LFRSALEGGSDESAMPGWLHRAARRRRLLQLGLSLTEQMATPTYELDAILAVDTVVHEWEADEQERASKG